MKKLLALVLSLVMALSLIPTVWGTELDDVFAQLWEAGYRAPTTEPRMEFPSGLVRGVDYDCIYQYEENYKDYVLTIVVKEGTSADWETAYQNDGVDSGNLDMVIFMPEPDSDVVRTSRSLNGNISGSRVNSFVSGTGLDYTDQVLKTPGTGVSIAALNRSEDSVTITGLPHNKRQALPQLLPVLVIPGKIPCAATGAPEIIANTIVAFVAICPRPPIRTPLLLSAIPPISTP